MPWPYDDDERELYARQMQGMPQAAPGPNPGAGYNAPLGSMPMPAPKSSGGRPPMPVPQADSGGGGMQQIVGAASKMAGAATKSMAAGRANDRIASMTDAGRRGPIETQEMPQGVGGMEGLISPTRPRQVMGIPGMARGGPVEEEEPYMVGEEGPEMFVPDQPGYIVPHNQTQKPTGPQPVTPNFDYRQPPDPTGRAATEALLDNPQGSATPAPGPDWLNQPKPYKAPAPFNKQYGYFNLPEDGQRTQRSPRSSPSPTPTPGPSPSPTPYVKPLAASQTMGPRPRRDDIAPVDRAGRVPTSLQQSFAPRPYQMTPPEGRQSFQRGSFQGGSSFDPTRRPGTPPRPVPSPSPTPSPTATPSASPTPGRAGGYDAPADAAAPSAGTVTPATAPPTPRERRPPPVAHNQMQAPAPAAPAGNPDAILGAQPQPGAPAPVPEPSDYGFGPPAGTPETTRPRGNPPASRPRTVAAGSEAAAPAPPGEAAAPSRSRNVVGVDPSGRERWATEAGKQEHVRPGWQRALVGAGYGALVGAARGGVPGALGGAATGGVLSAASPRLAGNIAREIIDRPTQEMAKAREDRDVARDREAQEFKTKQAQAQSQLGLAEANKTHLGALTDAEHAQAARTRQTTQYEAGAPGRDLRDYLTTLTDQELRRQQINATNANLKHSQRMQELEASRRLEEDRQKFGQMTPEQSKERQRMVRAHTISSFSRDELNGAQSQYQKQAYADLGGKELDDAILTLKAHQNDPNAEPSMKTELPRLLQMKSTITGLASTRGKETLETESDYWDGIYNQIAGPDGKLPDAKGKTYHADGVRVFQQKYGIRKFGDAQRVLGRMGATVIDDRPDNERVD